LVIWQYGMLAGLGLLAGFLNVMAGGGSLITMPVMIFLGMPPAMANGTNRVALLAQNVSAVTGFRSKGFSDFKLSMTLALCTLPGAVLGAFAAVKIDPLWFKRLLALVMVGALVEILRGKSGRKGDQGDGRVRRLPAYLGMVAVGFYGGFIQAGVGFILMALLHGLLRLDLVRVNMHKVFIVGVYMVPSLMVFALTGQVDWLAGALLAVGNAAGGWIGAHASVKGGERAIKIVFALAVVAMAIKLVLG
jgi:uncharacterized membrane protein YfcA